MTTLATVAHPNFRSVTVETNDPEAWIEQGWLPISVRPPEVDPAAAERPIGRRRKK